MTKLFHALFFVNFWSVEKTYMDMEKMDSFLDLLIACDVRKTCVRFPEDVHALRLILQRWHDLIEPPHVAQK